MLGRPPEAARKAAAPKAAPSTDPFKSSDPWQDRLPADEKTALDKLQRIDFVQKAIQRQAETFLKPLAEKYDVRFYSMQTRELKPWTVDLTRYGKDAPKTAAGPFELPKPPEPGGAATHLGDAVAGVLDAAAGRNVAGVVVFSDGRNTGGVTPSQAGRAAADRQTPVFTVPAGAAVKLRDVAIVDAFTSGLVSVGDSVRVAVTLESQGYDGRLVKVELREGDRLLDVRELSLRGVEQQQIELGFEAKEPGPRYLTIHVPPFADEPEFLRSNNTDLAFVRVSDEKIKVLMVEGRPRWDFRFLKNALRRDHGVGGRQGDAPDVLLQTELKRLGPTGTAAAFPATLEELAQYHVVVLGDVGPDLLDEGFVDLLIQAVREKGVGLVVAAGPQAMPHAFGDSFLELLPVKLRTGVPGVEAPVYNPFKMELSPEGAVHEAMRLYDDPGRTQALWAAMPPYYWCAAVERPAPAASVLAYNPSLTGRYGKTPLVAYHYAGEGRVLFVGTDSTWLWRQNVGDRYFYKFWGQTVRFVARRKDADRKKSWLEVRPVRCQPGEQAEIELTAFDAEGTPRTEPKQTVLVAGPKGTQSVELSADPSAKGRYRGALTPTES
ncbi:MAG: hypothetical protein ACRDD1_10980, partial [Planctomycetia bacterium]